MEYNKLQLSKFEFDTQSYSTYYIIGKRSSGKTHLINHILTKLNTSADFLSNTLVIGYEFSKQEYPSDIKVISDYDPDIITEYLRKEAGCIVFDNSIFKIPMWDSCKELHELFYGNRHYKKSIIVCMETSSELFPAIRYSFDHLFLFNEPYKHLQKELYENFGSMLPSFDSFKEILSILTCNKYHCMILNKSNSNRLRDHIFWYSDHSASLKVSQ